MKSELDLLCELNAALTKMDWHRLDELCPRVAAYVCRSRHPPSDLLRSILSPIRRKRRFRCLARIAGAIIDAGYATHDVRVAYAQALIDEGLLPAAESFLQDLTRKTRGPSERDEVQGLIGRTLKQRYVKCAGPDAADVLRRAIKAYEQAYRRRRDENLWHGINAVALIDRARRDGVSIDTALNMRTAAKALVAAVRKREAAKSAATDPWLIAIALEAHIALGENKAAAERALQYMNSGAADAFEIGSTLRQLVEVWQLTDEREPGKSVLTVLRGALLAAEGSSLKRSGPAIADERDLIRGLERRFGLTSSKTLSWYKEGLDRCAAIARIETRGDGQGRGTGWLVRLGDLQADGSRDLVLVTNAHVVRDPDSESGVGYLPEDVIANFQVSGHRTRIKKLVWSSRIDQFDCTVLRLDTPPPKVQPLPISLQKVRVLVPPARMYIIGYPGSRDIEFSLQDNYLLDCDERYLHYRTPTEEGSSGSPVFDERWQVVGLHHRGDRQMPQLNGKPGTYEANEALAIRAVIAAQAKPAGSKSRTK